MFNAIPTVTFSHCQQRFVMDKGRKIFSSNSKNFTPIIDGQCCVNITTSKLDNLAEPARNASGHSRWDIIKHCDFIYIIVILVAITILWFTGFLVYVTVKSGYLNRTVDPYEISQRQDSMIRTCPTDQPTKDPHEDLLCQYLYNEQLRQLSPELRSMILQMDRVRAKRDTVPCEQNTEHCRMVFESMWSIVNIVNSSMPHLQAFLRNFSADTSASKSKFVELVECLQCKNDHDPTNDHHAAMHEHADHAQIKQNIDMVNDLLNEVVHEDGKQSSSDGLVDFATLRTTGMDEGVGRVTTSIGERGNSEQSKVSSGNEGSSKKYLIGKEGVTEKSKVSIENEGNIEKSEVLNNNEGDTEKSTVLIGNEGVTEKSKVLNNNEGNAERSTLLIRNEGVTEKSKVSSNGEGNSEKSTLLIGNEGVTEKSKVSSNGEGNSEKSTALIGNGDGAKKSTMSVRDDNQREDQTKATETRSPTIGTTGSELQSLSTGSVNATASAGMTKKEGTTTQTSKLEDGEGAAVTANVMTETDGGNATEMVNNTVHPSVDPSGQGHGDRSEQELKGPEGTSKPKFRGIHRRIVSKVNMDSAPGTIPTAETIKSSQQLQLSPSISWVPYQVCFYGSPPSGPMKQSTSPGQIMYPGSSSGGPYPFSMPQQRQGYQNANQPPNYVQVQAQSVQFFPAQPYPGNAGQSGQKVGPTGPAYPMFPGHQASPSGAAANYNSRTPYYCTYIPAPTFQFPAIPGVTDYQRSSAGSGSKEEAESVGGNETEDRGSFLFEHPNTCPGNMIRCSDGRSCILRSQWCDGQVDCNDASDETTCSCRDRISEERLCDGYFDCPHGEDELGCLGCPKTSFSCNDWQRRYTQDNCVPLSQRCDGVKQCANGKDEMDCNILTPSYIEGRNIFTIGYTEGYLHKNFKGQWYPVCTAISSWAQDACASEIGLNTSEVPELKIYSLPDNAYQGPYVAEVDGQINLVPSCMNTAIFVRCPKFPCGTSVPSRGDSLRPNVLEEEGKRPLSSLDEIVWPTFEGKMDPRSGGNGNNASELDEMVGSQLRVVGGRASQPQAWPSLVAIYKDGFFYCGGVILNELWVLTAAHCLDGYAGHYFEIQAGVLRRFSFSPMSQSRKARYTVIHPLYSSKDMRNDIGMIMLDDPLRFNRWVRPVCLPDSALLGSMWRLKPEPGSTCIAIGWGATREHGTDPDHLREVEVPILQHCKYEFDQTEAAICAGYPQGGRDACQGDSGGPLMCRNPNSESQWYVAGIVSHGEGCGRPNEPGTYTRVSYFLDWIQEISSGRGVPPLRRTPLEKCPGFSCEGGLGKCLPIELRCNRMVDCLDGEDEINCRDYPLYRHLHNPYEDFVVGSSIEPDNSTTLDVETVSIKPNVVNNTAEVMANKPRLEEARINNLEPDGGSNATSKISNEIKNDTNDINYAINEISNVPDDAKDVSAPTPAVPRTTFTCTRLLQSIPKEKRCNRVADCEDTTDEANCTCREFLQNIKPAAICDGYVDCDDQTDEQDCKICAEDEFFCRTSKICIPMSKTCNGKFDCMYKEDELDYFTLTDGQRVFLDADDRPFLRMQGILTQHVNGTWQPVCHHPRIHQNQSTITLIGKNMCEYFGFTSRESSETVTVKNSKLETITWRKDNPEYRQAASLNEDDETCPGVYIRCTPVLDSSMYTHMVIDSSTGSRDHLWPWLAAIFVDGRYRCKALLLDRSWLLAAAKCLENVRLDENYITAVLGYGSLFNYTDGPHQQMSFIDEVLPVNNSVSILLHLKNQIKFSRHVRPLFLEKTVYLPGLNDTCVAVGTNNDYETKSIFLRPVLQSCPSCQRCFVNISSSECWESEVSEWSGTIFCRGKKGWYPAAVYDIKGVCNFKDLQSITSIDHINPYLLEAIDGARQPIVEAPCNGFRCNIGQCIPQNRICDGVPDCRGQEDEDPTYCKRFRENCENSVEGCSCAKMELRCRNGKCIDKSSFCDGYADCSDGSDEPMLCTCAEYLKLVAPERLCDGVRNCVDKTDESPEMCPCRDSSFTCATTIGNDTCIPQDFVCDGVNDCLHGEDESECRKLKPFSEDSDKSGEVIRRSYGVWHSECFPRPISSNQNATDLCKSMGYHSGSINNDTVIVDEPMIPKPDEFYMVRINGWTWTSLRDDKPFVTLEKSNETCYRALVDCF